MDDSRYIDKVNKTHNIEEARQRKLKRRKISYIVLISVIFLVFLYLCYLYLFKISEVEYVGNEHYTVDELMKVFDVHEGDRLFSYSKEEKENLILETFPYISECTITRTIPDKVTLTISERKAVMYTHVSGKFALFDDSMMVVELSDKAPEGLLKVEIDNEVLSKCVLGQELGFKDEKTGIGIKRVYDSLVTSSVYNEIKYMSVKSRFDYYLNYADKYEVYLGDSTDCDSKLLFMSGIIEKLYEEDKGVIDVSNPKEGTFRKK